MKNMADWVSGWLGVYGYKKKHGSRKKTTKGAHKHKYKVKYVKKGVLKDFAGMNYKAGKVMGFPIKKNTILIDRNLSKSQKARTLKHEKAEIKYMKRGHKYWSAHKKALREEK